MPQLAVRLVNALKLGTYLTRRSLFRSRGQSLNMSRFGNDNMESVANKTQNLEVVALYSFDFGLTPSIGYITNIPKVKT